MPIRVNIDSKKYIYILQKHKFDSRCYCESLFGRRSHKSPINTLWTLGLYCDFSKRPVLNLPRLFCKKKQRNSGDGNWELNWGVYLETGYGEQCCLPSWLHETRWSSCDYNLLILMMLAMLTIQPLVG